MVVVSLAWEGVLGGSPTTVVGNSIEVDSPLSSKVDLGRGNPLRKKMRCINSMAHRD